MPSQAPRHIKSILGANIEAARVAKNMRQRDLAAALDTDATSVSRWERGKVVPSLEALVRLADALDQTVDWFYVDHSADEIAA
jgi:transcriptional regulator with XRE-family HTH domain